VALLRSYLFAPGNSETLLGKVWLAGADAVVLDLEDAVPPGEKRRAREMVRRALEGRGAAGRPRAFVRINGCETSLWRDDLDAVVVPALAGVRLPKSETPEQVRLVDAELSRLESARGIQPGRLELALTIETAAGVLAAGALASASPRVRNLGFGAADFAQDVGAEVSANEAETLVARSLLVLQSRAQGLSPPVASAYADLTDEEGLRRTSEAARRLGFFGRSCIHPRQVAVVNRVFTPTSAAVERARAVVAAYEAASAAGSGAVALADGEFVDLAVVRRARRVLEVASILQEAAQP
jgi:citrate lyase subunit beta/citryl-CoA lyase